MPHFFTQIGSTVLCAGHPVAQVDTDRIAVAGHLVRECRIAPLAAHLIACRGWYQPVAQAYSLLGNDAERIITWQDALAHGRARGVLQ